MEFEHVEEPPWGEKPGDDSGWSDGQIIAHNGVSDAMPDKEDVAEILIDMEYGDRWDGVTAAVVKLKDGRYMAWESFYGPTGSGFSNDAYGGDAVVHFSDDLEQIKLMALSDETRNNL
jgi:hypothetical protein